MGSDIKTIALLVVSSCRVLKNEKAALPVVKYSFNKPNTDDVCRYICDMHSVY